MTSSSSRAYALLSAWALQAERSWYDLPGRSGLGCYGSGYNAWGVQTNQKYVAALAALALAPQAEPAVQVDRAWALERALAGLRFSLASHVSGPLACTDGSQWGHTWISALGLERMFHAVYRLEPHLSDADRAALRRVLFSEADWMLSDFRRGSLAGMAAGLWDKTGRNQPESNLWNGALLWRAAVTGPDEPHAAAWQEMAHRFLVNSISVPADAEDETLLAGQPLRARHLGANFFPHYALDHHGYLNVGYMAICVSNAAMLHFDLRLCGLPRPETLDLHQADLWSVLRRLVFTDGRLARIGGDSRVRYAYCQEYLLPALLYAADRLGDPTALQMVPRQLDLIETEAKWNADGSFYGKRLAPLAQASPFYATRLESDRACALAQLCTYLPLVPAAPNPPVEPANWAAGYEAAVAGGWCEPEHAAALQRSPRRLASFAWRAYGLAQGLCLPPQLSQLAEWEGNLCGQVEFVHHTNPSHPTSPMLRRLLAAEVRPFEGGFLTWGALSEGAEVELAEGWKGRDLARHQLVLAALPDDQTVLGLEYCALGQGRGLLRQVKGLHLNIPNDLYNGFTRRLETSAGALELSSPPVSDAALPLGGRWTCVDGVLGVVGLYGATELVVSRSARRRGGALETLYVEEVCFTHSLGPRWADAGEVVLDCGWAVLSSADAARTAQAAAGLRRLPAELPGLRLAACTAADGRSYLLAANFGPAACHLPAPLGPLLDLASGQPAAGLAIPAGEGRLYRVG